jgi:uncharacterized protein YyaL (SSP411 family)
MIADARVVQTAKYYLSLARVDIAAAYLTLPRRVEPPAADALAEAIAWICRAQDAFPSAGVARSYAIAYHPHFRRAGWIAPYPETTGYIIPTLFDYARRMGRDDLFARATRMADWECDVQLENGAVQGGTIDERPTPAIFNTGQVIFGWVRAYEETGRERYLDAAVRAGDFLLAMQSRDGAWRKNLSDYATRSLSSYTYNTRTAWALERLATSTGNTHYRDAAVRNIEFALKEQLANGWFRHNCLFDPERPLVHTIAYATRGVLEVGIAVDNQTYIAAARRAADALLARQRPDGSLSGQYDSNWEPAANYSCLTGNAQMGIIWGRLYQLTGEEQYRRALARANDFLRTVQWLGTGNPGLDGGISGSYPLHGAYGRFEVLNWATKFFADSLMIDAAIAEGRPAAPRHMEAAR